MLWIVITGLCLAALAFRVVTLNGRPQVWWVAFTGTLVFIIPGAGFLMNESAVNESVGVPNVASLLSTLSFTAAAGCVQVYVHALRRAVPSPRWMAVHVLTAVAVGVLVTAGWVAAPIHDRNYASFHVLIHLDGAYPWALLHYALFHVYLGAALANVSMCAGSLVRSTPAHDPGRRYGLLMVAAAAALDVVAQALYLAEMPGWGPTLGSPPIHIADLATVIVMFGIALGTVTFLMVPPLMAWLHARRLVSALAPLWHAVLSRVPDVRLPTPAVAGVSVRAERMVIELNDGLRRCLANPLAEDSDPYRVAAQALASPPPLEGIAISTMLPTPSTRQEEEASLLRLAQEYCTTEGIECTPAVANAPASSTGSQPINDGRTTTGS